MDGLARVPEQGGTDMSEEDLLIERSDRVGTITLNRPEQRNALTRSLRRGIPAAVTELDSDDDVDVILLTGADPAFCAGLDLIELSSGDGSKNLNEAVSNRRGPLPPHRKPVVAAVNGVAVTGGLELVLACDLVIASERARFADTHARVGVMPGWGLTVLLPEAVGVRRAREMSITGNYVDAQLAFEWGLVNHVVTHEDLIPFCRNLAADVISNDQDGVRRMLETYGRTTAVGTDEAWAVEADMAAEWQRDRFDNEAIARRLEGIVTRGRDQK
jgi:enoyl-CoA hydratase